MKTVNLVFKLARIGLFAAAFFLLLSPLTGAYAACCAGHGGVASCNKATGFKMCKDGTASPSCTCPKAKVKAAKQKALKVKKEAKAKAKSATTVVPATTTTAPTTTTKPKSGWWWGKKSTTPTTTPAKTTTGVVSARGCCSRHGGVAQCNKVTGHQMCKDGTVSATCVCR